MGTHNRVSPYVLPSFKSSTSLIESLETCFKNIKKHENLNAFLEVFEDEARERAILIQAKIDTQKGGKLAGMIIGLKDNLCFKGHKVSAASKILENFVSPYTATVVQRLIDEDAIIIGRLNCDEFAMGASNENSAFGNVKNGQNILKVPGGSSGGSAVAVQMGFCHASLGSDTGGSIRQPASFCGVVGFKPTYGRLSRWGLLAYASSFDQIGPFSSSIDDTALLLEVMAGKDDNDATVSQRPVDNYTDLSENKKYKIAYIKDALEHSGLDTEIRDSTLKTISELKNKGHQVDAIDFPYLDYMVPCYYVLTTAEASSNYSRYSGLTHGHRSKSAEDLDTTFTRSRSEGFGPEVKRRIMLGTFVLSAGYYDAYYSKAQKVRQVIRQKTNEILKEYDFIILPTTSTPAFDIGAKAKDPIAMYLADLYTVQANLAGNPAISIPIYHHQKEDMPFGLQIIGDNFKEKDLLSFSKDLMGQ